MTKEVLAANGSTSTYRGLVGWVREYDDDDDDDNNDDDDNLNYYNFYNNLLFSILLFISFHKIKYRYICSRWIGDLFVHLSPFGVRLRELASIALRAYLEGT